MRSPLDMITEVVWNLWQRGNFMAWMQEAVDCARACAACGVCETRCPQGLEIRETLKAHVAVSDGVTA